MNRIKSIIDVITNSSDECYIVKTNLTAQEAKDKFYDYMNKEHSEEWNEEWKKWFHRDRETYAPDDIFESTEEPGGIVFDWGSMCNLDNAEGYLKECFGEDNVKESNESHIFRDIDTSWIESLLSKRNEENK